MIFREASVARCATSSGDRATGTRLKRCWATSGRVAFRSSLFRRRRMARRQKCLAHDASTHWSGAQKKSYLVKAAGGRFCWGCGRDFDHDRYLEIDHIRPRVDRGSDSVSNLALLCAPCNRRKSAHITLTGLRERNIADGFMVKEIDIPSIPIIWGPHLDEYQRGVW